MQPHGGKPKTTKENSAKRIEKRSRQTKAMVERLEIKKSNTGPGFFLRTEDKGKKESAEGKRKKKE